jgi:hypothetical protein
MAACREMIDPTKLYQKMYDAGADWSDKDAAANLLEETKKSVLAQIASSVVGTNADRERHALATQEYQDHVKAMVDARKEANKARAQYDSIRTYIELVRTVESTKRAEMQMR